ncbi:MAG: hypothetical protein OdinLCB4_003685 [Candidatus Odinarchaeum yellowstonii]|jgi:hypothetical protein|uniref:Uncharacterized protein n=1 Tax=Odinarchaeota yellowstonii (strain LCB_4) TaxID=1841599 RepID=A0AAF0D3M1_ODILC|nr:MAG: hypothetical protein OdinLCB4_003685 [Candidatus Odinarchaeum yellowstonii]
MPKHIIDKDSQTARKIYDEYSKSQRSRKISPEFEEMLNLSDEDRCFRVRVVGKTSLEDLLLALEKSGVKPVPGSWSKPLISAIVYANKKQIYKLMERDEVKYIRYIEKEACAI